MTALHIKTSWKQQHETVVPTSVDDVLLLHEDETQMEEARAWTHKLLHGENGSSPKPNDEERSSMLRLPANKPMIVETSRKKNRFSLRRLFKHESHDQDKKAAVFVSPVSIPVDFLVRERHGAVTVSGKRVPFTRDAHRRKKTTTKLLPCINEDRAVVPGCSSQEAYRRRAYYPAKKDKAKK